MVAYEQRLERLGYRPECAKRIVADYIKIDKLNALIDYIDLKESELKSILEHLDEVIG